ncbi:replication-relaxation family protein [Dactylosporangium sp. CS-047395]|uniref:replication-relaxation family protein n=1 Tax=Dactylosporangium sp. CS-047395 TaxID=3239936 RepID=UPI003D91438F
MAKFHIDPVLYVQAFLNERDLRLLDLLYDHRVLTTSQIETALFDSRRQTAKRLLRLYQLGLLQRFRPARRTVDGGLRLTLWRRIGIDPSP